jgi:hypothetical protein
MMNFVLPTSDDGSNQYSRNMFALSPQESLQETGSVANGDNTFSLSPNMLKFNKQIVYYYISVLFILLLFLKEKVVL